MSNTTLHKLALRAAPWALPLGLLAAWQLAVASGWLSSRILPAPSAVLAAGFELSELAPEPSDLERLFFRSLAHPRSPRDRAP